MKRKSKCLPSPPPENLKNVSLVCLMANYNKKQTIEKSIRSVLMQQTNFKYQLIILDDCSTDGSYEIALKLAKEFKDKIILLRSKQNEGYLARILEGYSYLKNIPYFCVLDSDDWYIYPFKFQEAVDFLKNHSDYVCYFAQTYLLKKGEVLNEKDENLFQLQHPHYLDFTWQDYQNKKGVFIQTSGCIYKNVYMQKNVPEKLLKFAKRQDGAMFRGDGFRNPWHMQMGKTHFVNRFESVYNYDETGLWSQLNLLEQLKKSLIANFAFFDFFENDIYWLKCAQQSFEKIIGFLKENPEKIKENENFIFDYFQKIYLTKYTNFNPFEKEKISIQNKNEKKSKVNFKKILNF